MSEDASFVYSFGMTLGSRWNNRPLLMYWPYFRGDRVEIVFSTASFALFREEMAKDGVILVEIERVPYHEPESVP